MARTDLTIPELNGKFVDYREQIWGDSFNWCWARSSTEVKYLVIHHSVTAHDATPDDIATLHKARGWSGIGYHFVVTKDGRVWYVGDVSTARANVADMNDKVIGICLIGDFTKHLPSDDQIVSAHKLCKFFLEAPQWPNVSDWKDVVGHKELQATACPGTSWDKSQESDMWWRIKTGSPYYPPMEENVEDAINDEKVDSYDELFELVNEKLKLPLGNRDLPTLRGRCVELTTVEGNYKVLKENSEKFIRDTAKGLGVQEESEEAVRKALVALQEEIKPDLGAYVKKMSLWELLRLRYGK